VLDIVFQRLQMKSYLLCIIFFLFNIWLKANWKLTS